MYIHVLQSEREKERERMRVIKSERLCERLQGTERERARDFPVSFCLCGVLLATCGYDVRSVTTTTH